MSDIVKYNSHGILRVFQGCSMGVSREFQGSFGDVPKVFQGESLLQVSMVLQG